jgi:hypothetical protein
MGEREKGRREEGRDGRKEGVRERTRGEERKRYHKKNRKKIGVTILIPGRTDYIRIISGIKGYFIMIKGSILQEFITTINVYVSNNIAS